MALKEKSAAEPQTNRLPLILDVYGRVMSGVLMLFGLFHWAVILGVVDGAGGSFEEMSAAWKMATITLAVVDLVAAVGLWQRVAWGNVLWYCAALFEVSLHTVFMGTYGADFILVAFHIASVAGFAALSFAARRTSAN